LESISDALVTIDREWKITSVNPKAAEINKKPPQDFLGNYLWEEWPLLEDSPFGEIARQSMQDGIPRQVEIHYYIEGIYDVWLDVNIYPHEDGLTLIYRDINVQKKLEKTLLESEERLRLAVTGAQQGIYDVNIETGEVVINDIYAEMLGYDPETFRETIEGWMGKLHPDDYEYSTQYFNDYISGKIEDYELEFRFAHSDGSYIWIMSLGSIVARDENGKPIRMLGTHTDITDRKNAEQEKVLFSNIVEESLNEVFVFDAETFKFIQVNKAATENLGYSYKELMNMTPIHIAPEYSVEKIDALVAPLRQGKQRQLVVESFHQRKDGSTYEVEVHLQLQKMMHESVFTAIIQDISERKKTEKLIFDERQRLANIIKGTNVATWEWNIQTGEVIFDDRWAEMLGYTLDELNPLSIETWKNLTNSEDLPKAEALLQNHFEGKIDYYDIEFRMQYKDGHWVWVQDRGRVSEWSEDGKPLVMVGTHHDITQRKESEEKIIQQLDELRRWHELTLGREERIIELKKEINEELIAQGESPRYESVLS
jgi:PAS domain S-box-containing protein